MKIILYKNAFRDPTVFEGIISAAELPPNTESFILCDPKILPGGFTPQDQDTVKPDAEQLNLSL
jgi:hypothetical protein